MGKRILATATVALLGLIAASDVKAATGDDRWLPFQGCWRAENAPSSNALCVVSDGVGVRMVELADGAIVRETRFNADGQPRPITQEGCTGTERARWSADGRRLYLDTELTCGDQIKRNTIGVFSVISPMEWVSINAVLVDNEAATRTVTYRAVETALPEMTSLPGASRAAVEAIFTQLRENRLARETARYAAARPLTLEQLREASSEVHPRVVEALVLARRQQFDLDGKKLLALADAGVPSYLIDAVVAVSNPDKFEVKDRVPVAEEERTRSGYAGRYCDAWDDWYDPWCRGYGYNRYSPFGYYGFNNYGYGGYYGSYYGLGFRGAPIIVVRGPDSDQVTRGRATPRGYTSGRSSSGSSSSAARSGTSGGSSTSSSSGSSSSGSATTSSSGGSSTVTGKAKPRGGN